MPRFLARTDGIVVDGLFRPEPNHQGGWNAVAYVRHIRGVERRVDGEVWQGEFAADVWVDLTGAQGRCDDLNAAQKPSG